VRDQVSHSYKATGIVEQSENESKITSSRRKLFNAETEIKTNNLREQIQSASILITSCSYTFDPQGTSWNSFDRRMELK
jgi:hypothetical protein